VTAVALRPVGPDDRDRILAWRNDPAVAAQMYSDHLITPEEHAAWFARFLSDPDRAGRIIEADGKAVGFLSLAGIRSPERRAEWAWYIGEASARGLGVGRAAQALALEEAFGPMGLREVWSQVLADNAAALKSQRAAGFVDEAVWPAHVVKGGAPRDVVLLAIKAPA